VSGQVASKGMRFLVRLSDRDLFDTAKAKVGGWPEVLSAKKVVVFMPSGARTRARRESSHFLLSRRPAT